METSVDMGDEAENIISTMRDSGEFLDVDLRCQEGSFGLQKLVLILHSEYYRERFLHLDRLAAEMGRSSGKASILLQHTEPIDIINIITYIYEGKVSVMKHQVPGFVAVAKQLRIDDIERVLTNVESIHNASATHNSSTLVTHDRDPDEGTVAILMRSKNHHHQMMMMKSFKTLGPILPAQQQQQQQQPPGLLPSSSVVPGPPSQGRRLTRYIPAAKSMGRRNTSLGTEEDESYSSYDESNSSEMTPRGGGDTNNNNNNEEESRKRRHNWSRSTIFSKGSYAPTETSQDHRSTMMADLTSSSEGEEDSSSSSSYDSAQGRTFIKRGQKRTPIHKPPSGTWLVNDVQLRC